MDGRLCRPESVDDLAFHMEDLLRSPETRARYVQAARQSVMRFEVSAVVKEYEDLFCQLVNP